MYVPSCSANDGSAPQAAEKTHAPAEDVTERPAWAGVLESQPSSQGEGTDASDQKGDEDSLPVRCAETVQNSVGQVPYRTGVSVYIIMHVNNPCPLLVTGRAALWMLRFYKDGISPMMPSSCRFLPTCSSYSMDSYKAYGVSWGS